MNFYTVKRNNAKNFARTKMMKPMLFAGNAIIRKMDPYMVLRKPLIKKNDVRNLALYLTRKSMKLAI